MPKLPRFTAPYYLAGNSKHRWHEGHAEKAVFGTAVMGAGATALLHPRAQKHALNYVQHNHGIYASKHQANTAGKALIGAAAVTAAYGGFHAYKAHQVKKDMMNRKGNVYSNRKAVHVKH